MSFFRTVAVALVAASPIAWGAVAAPPTLAAPMTFTTSSQFTFFDETVRHEAQSYATFHQTAPADWRAPTDYVNGTPVVRLEILQKPSDLPVQLLVCMWRDRYVQETCRSLGKYTTTGLHWLKLAAPGVWWKKGAWDWDRPIDFVRLLVKDVATGSLLTTSHCGAACYSGTENVLAHTPIVVNAEMIVVAAGAKLTPPADWGGCPTALTTICVSPTAVTPTTAPATTAPATTLPPATTVPATTVPPTTLPPATLPPATTAPPTTAPTTVPAPSVSPTTAPATTAPATTAPATTVPATTVPPTTLPSTTLPPTTVPPTTVAPLPNPTVTVAGLVRTRVGQRVTIDATVTHATVVSWWTKSGPAPLIWHARTVEDAVVTFRTPGTYILVVRASRDGLVARRLVTVDVAP